METPSTDQANDVAPRRKSRPLTLLGLVLTVAYLIAVGWYWRADTSTLLALEPNAFGDFLAGTFAPLAFLWLVLGFLQQGDELRNSADALWLQGQELQCSVEQQRDLVNVTREQLRFDGQILREQRDEIARSAKPILRLASGMNMGSGDGLRIYEFVLFNHGQPCTDVGVRIGDAPRMIATVPLLDKGSRMDFRRKLPPAGAIPAFDVVISYLDGRMLPGVSTFEVSRSSNNAGFDIIETTATHSDK